MARWDFDEKTVTDENGIHDLPSGCRYRVTDGEGKQILFCKFVDTVTGEIRRYDVRIENGWVWRLDKNKEPLS